MKYIYGIILLFFIGASSCVDRIESTDCSIDCINGDCIDNNCHCDIGFGGDDCSIDFEKAFIGTWVGEYKCPGKATKPLEIDILVAALSTEANMYFIIKDNDKLNLFCEFVKDKIVIQNLFIFTPNNYDRNQYYSGEGIIDEKGRLVITLQFKNEQYVETCIFTGIKQ